MEKKLYTKNEKGRYEEYQVPDMDKSIEERAKLASEGYEDDGYSAGLYMGYIVGAKEQKIIDDAELYERFQKALNGEKLYWLDKACEWLEAYIACGVSPEGTYAFVARFRKAMEE